MSSLPQSPRILVPLTRVRAADAHALLLRARAQAALIEARYTRWADLDVCLRCNVSPRVGGVYCAECAALMQHFVDVPTIVPVSVPCEGWGTEGWTE